MIPQKAMAITLRDLEVMAIYNLLYKYYEKSNYLSNQIDYLLAGFVFLLEEDNLSLSEQTTALIFLDSLLQLRINFKQAKGVRCG